MNFFKFIPILFLMILWPNESFARDIFGGFFLEPAITYELGDSKISYPSPLSNSTGDIQGFGVGGRVGLHLADILFFGLDGRYSMPRFKDSSVNYESSSTAWNWGPVIGVQMPDLGLRGWGTAVVGGEIDPEASGSFDARFADATGFRLGVGFRVMSFSLNLEYQQLDYGDAILEQAGPFTPGTNFDSVDLENRSWIASVSFPLEF